MINLQIVSLVIIIAILIPVYIKLSARKLMDVSAKYRQNKFHKIDNYEVDQIVSIPEECKFNVGFSGPGLDESATIVVVDNAIKIITNKDGKIHELPLDQIRNMQSPDPGTLYIFPRDSKALALVNDGRWGIFFGKSFIERGYGELPFKWQPKAKEMWAADRIAVAYFLYIKRTLEARIK